MSCKFTFGVEGLDELLGRVLSPGSLLVIAGDPGSGKTTLATTMCYKNALKGCKSLYISFQEDRDKLFKNLERLGVNLKSVEEEGLMRFVKLPLITEEDAVTSVVEWISHLLEVYKCELVVVDSVTPLLRVVRDDVKARAVLTNFFSELPRIIGGIVVLVAEAVSEGEFGLGDIEYVADAILALRYRVEGDLLVRELEVLKARGAPISVAKMPFTIIENVGFRIYAPPLLEEIPRVIPGRLKLPCKILSSYLDHLHRGYIVYVTYPPDARPFFTPVLLAGLAVVNNLKVLLISYKHSAYEVKNIFYSAFKSHGLSEEVADKVLERFIIKGVNPAGISCSQLSALEMELAEKYKPDVMAFHGIEVARGLREASQYNYSLLNQLLYLKKLGTLVIRSSAYNGEFYGWDSSLSDVIMKFMLDEEGGEPRKYKLYIWRREKSPITLKHEEVEECLRETVKNIVESVKSRLKV